jgi:hypothetical protein
MQADDVPTVTAPILTDHARKGNVNRKGERIYFRPGQLDYARVDMSRPGRRWFWTEQDAQAAGWRPAAR